MQERVETVLGEKAEPARVESITPSATVSAAVAQMNEHRIGALVVMDAERLVGIFTERDVLVRVVAARKNPDVVRVVDVMTSDLAVIGPSTTVQDAMAAMTEKRCRHLPIVDDGRLLGLVSIGDLTRWLVRNQQKQLDELVHYISGTY